MIFDFFQIMCVYLCAGIKTDLKSHIHHREYFSLNVLSCFYLIHLVEIVREICHSQLISNEIGGIIPRVA